MIVEKGITLPRLVRWSLHHIIWLTAMMATITGLYHNIIEFEIWLPVSVIGTAVAFYVGFKNNQTYDRMWQARKIWGGIVNESQLGHDGRGYIKPLR